MYILTQDKKKIIEIGKVEVSSNLTFKKEDKYALIATARTSTNSLSDAMVIGYYPSEETALAELRSIFTALNSNQPVYEVR